MRFFVWLRIRIQKLFKTYPEDFGKPPKLTIGNKPFSTLDSLYRVFIYVNVVIANRFTANVT